MTKEQCFNIVAFDIASMFVEKRKTNKTNQPAKPPQESEVISENAKVYNGSI